MRWAIAAVAHARVLHYAIALMTSVVALQPVLLAGQRGVPTSLLLFLGAVVVSARYGGLLPGLLSAFLGALVNLVFSLVSVSALTTGSLVASAQAAGFVVIALAIIAITEQRRRERERLRYYADLVSALSRDPARGVCVLDREGRVTFINSAAERVLGWVEAELRGKDLHRAMHSAQQVACPGTPEERCSLRAILGPSSSSQTGQTELMTKDGEVVQVEYTSSPLFRARRVRGAVFTFRDVTEIKRTLASLQESEERYRSLVETSPDSLLLTDLYGYVTLANQQAAALYGYAGVEDLLGTRILDLVAPEDRLRQLEDDRNVVAGRGDPSLSPVGSREYRGQKQDGSVFPVEFRVALISDEEGLPRALLHVCTDLTERRRTEATLQMREVCAAAQHAAALALAQSVTLGEAASNVLQAICETAGWDAGILWILDAADGVLRCHTIWHGPATDLGGLEELSRQLTLTRGDDLPGHTWASGTVTWIPDIVADERSPRVLMASRAGLRTNLCVPILASGVIRGVMELFSRIVQEADDDLRQSLSTICAQFGQFMDRKEAEKALEYQARHDALTNLPNRVLLRERMERALVAARAQDIPLAFLLLDLDRFKEVNDTLGHHYGDLLLRQVSSRLAAALRDSDTVARLGGDEFAVLLPATNVAGASQVADKILKVIEEPYRLEGQQVDVGTSIGIAVCPQHGQDAYALMQRADVAMYAAKQAQVGYAVYTATQDEHSPERLSLVAELRLAIAHQRLLLHYQPKVNLKTGQIESVEALARWHHPGRGMVPPDQFVPLAEQSGLIKPLGYFVLNEALRQCKRWQQGALDLAVAVNLSAGNIRDPRLVDVISELLEKHGLDARSLTLEITESAIMGDAQQTIEALTQLHGMGVRIAIDDFGTGYSSLAYLRRLPAHEIKIDRSFVMDMVQQEDDAFIARTVIDLGHRLGLQVVAEGVQSPEVWDMLEDMECDHAQGFYLSRPLSASDLTTWFDESQFEAGTPTRIRRIHTYRRTQAPGA